MKTCSPCVTKTTVCRLYETALWVCQFICLFAICISSLLSRLYKLCLSITLVSARQLFAVCNIVGRAHIVAVSGKMVVAGDVQPFSHCSCSCLLCMCAMCVLQQKLKRTKTASLTPQLLLICMGVACILGCQHSNLSMHCCPCSCKLMSQYRRKPC